MIRCDKGVWKLALFDISLGNLKAEAADMLSGNLGVVERSHRPDLFLEIAFET